MQNPVDKFSQEIKFDPKDQVFYSNRSVCYVSLNLYDKTLQDAEKCLEINPGWIKGYYRKSFAEFHAALYDKSIKTFEKALEIEPQISRFYYKSAKLKDY